MHTSISRIYVASIVVSICLFVASAFSQTVLVWDANGTGTGQVNGSGQWLGTGQWWNGSANVDWDTLNPTIAQLGVAGAAGGSSNTITITNQTVTVAGLNILGYSATPSASAPPFTIAASGTGTLAFADNAVINIADNASNGNFFVTFTAPITGNNLTIQKSGGSTYGYFSFNGSTTLTGTLTLKGVNGGLWVRSNSPANFANVASIVVENGSAFTMTGGGTYAMALSIAGFGGSASYGALRVDTSNTTISGPITLTADAGILTNGAPTGTVISGGITGNYGFTRFTTITGGTGTLTFSGTNTYTGATNLGRAGSNNAGVTTLDFSAATAPETDILYHGVANAGTLNLNAGTNAATVLNLTGKAGTVNSQRFGDVIVNGYSTTNSGLTVINLTSGTGGSMSLSVGGITRSGLGLVAMRGPASGTITTTMSDGFLGPWATYRDASGVTTWAKVSGGVVTGGFTGNLGYTTGTAISSLAGYSSDSHLTISSVSTGNVTVGSGITDLRTVSMTDMCTDRVLNLTGGSLRLGATSAGGGGIQLGASAGDLLITGGTLTGGGPSANTAGQIIVTNNSIRSLLQIDSAITNNGTGAVTLLFNGVTGSKVVLGGNNTFTGGTTIASGAVELRNGTALGTSGSITVLTNAELQLSGGITVNRNLTVTGNGENNTGVIRNLSGNNTINSTVTMASTSLVTSDSGTLTFYNGSATANAITPSTTSIGLTFGGAGDIVVNSRINFTTQTVTKNGTGRLTLGGDNAVASSTGTFTVNDGVLRITHVNALGTTGGATTVNAGGTLELSFGTGSTVAEAITFNGAGFDNTGAIRNVSGDNTLSGALTTSSTSSTAINSITADAGTTLTLSGTVRNAATSGSSNRTVHLGGAGTINVTGAITNGGVATAVTHLTKIDAGTVNLRGANSYTGATTVSGGILNLDFANATPAAHLIVTNNALALGGGTLKVTGKDSTTNRQSFASTAMTAGRSAIVVNSGTGGSASLALGAITRAAGSGGVVDVILPTTGAVTTTTVNTNGIINGGITVGKNTWATSEATPSTGVAWANASDAISVGGMANGTQVSFSGTAPGGLATGVAYYVVNATGSSFQVSATEGGTVLQLTDDGTAAQLNTAGAISGLTTYASTFDANANVNVSAGTLTQGAATVNSLRFNEASGTSLGLSGTLSVLSGGILVTEAVTGDVSIQSNNTTTRTLSTSGELIIHHHGSGVLTIGSTISSGTTTTAVTKTGAGTVTYAALNGAASVQLRVYEGTFNVVGDNRFNGSSPPVLTIGSATTSAKISFGNGASAGEQIFGGTSTVLGTGSSLVGSGTEIYMLYFNTSGTQDFRNLMLGGAGGNENNIALKVASAGVIRLGDANTYAGRSDISRGTFEVTKLANAGAASSLGTGAQDSVIYFNDYASNSAAISTLRYVGSTDSVTDRVVRLHTAGNTMPSLTSIIENNGAGTVKFTSAFQVTGATTLQRVFRLSGTNAGQNEIVSISDGPSSIVKFEKTGAGTWVLTGNSTYTGGTTITGGLLQLGNGGSAGMVGSGDIAISAGATLGVNRSNSFTIASNITGEGAVVVNNTSSGVVIIDTVGNTYSGGTRVNSGTLMVNNAYNSGTGTGSVHVERAGTLAGRGYITPVAGNSVTICGALSVGEISTMASPLHITTSGSGSLIVEGGGVVVLDLVSGAGSGMLNAPEEADMLVIGGNVLLNEGSILRVQNLNGLVDWAVGDAWQIIDWSTLGTTRTGSFTTLDLPTLTEAYKWDTSGLYTSGIITVADAVPEPGRAMLLGVALFGLALRRRRRSL